jgi:DNA-binding LytR/AlgR family response regulator
MNYMNQSPDHLFLREGTTYIKIPLSEIQFIEADGNYAYLQTKSKRFAIKRSLAAISEELAAPEFVRASRGILVNFDQVDRVSFATGTIAIGDRELKMGKAYHGEIKSRMPRL